MVQSHSDEEYEHAEALLDEYERNPDAFDVDNGGERAAQHTGPIRLAASINVRFDADVAARLRALAASLDLGYTTLVRRFVVEGLDRMEGVPVPTAIHRKVLLDVEVSPAGDVTVTSKVA